MDIYIYISINLYITNNIRFGCVWNREYRNGHLIGDSDNGDVDDEPMDLVVHYFQANRGKPMYPMYT